MRGSIGPVVEPADLANHPSGRRRRSRAGPLRLGPIAWLAALLGGILGGPPAGAQAPVDIYRDRPIDLYIWTSVGGAYDTYSRVLARHLGRHIPGNPRIVPRNMEGAGGIKLANFLFNSAPRDGTAIGVLSRANAFDPLLGNKAAQFDGQRFNWIGSTNDEVSVCVSWHTSSVTRFADLLERELVVGATAVTADSYQHPRLVANVLGARLRIVTGYAGGNEVDLAMERGEVQGRCSWSWTSIKGLKRKWLDDRKINVLYQMGLRPHPDLAGTPLVLDLAQTEEARAMLRFVFARQVMAWPYVAPPGVPAERIEVLRGAFMAAMADKALLADAEQAGLDIAPVSGADIQRLVEEIHASPAEIARKVAAAIR